MSAAKEILTSNAPPPLKGVLSQALVVNGFVYCSGQIPADPVTNEVIEGDIAAHSKQVLKNLSAVLEAAGSSISKVVKVNVFLSDMGNFAAMNEVYSSTFPDPKPARTCVAVKTLPKNVDVEMECIGYI